MRWIVESCLKLRVLVVVLAVALVIFGTARIRDLPMGIMPEYGPPMVRVQTEALGLSPAEVEQFITAPLEQDLLNGVGFLRRIESVSVPGLSVVDLEFEPGTDLFVARQLVQERLTQAHALPNVSTPPQMIQPVSSTGRVMMIGMTSDEVSLIDMSLIARWTIKARLIGVPGVSNVSVWGMRDRQLQIRVDPAELSANAVSLRDVVTTSANALWTSPLGFVEASTPGTGGWIETPNQRLTIQHELPIDTAADLSRVVVATQGGATPLTIGDVADVVEDHQPLIGDASFEGQTGLMIVVEKFPWANTRDVTAALEEALDELSPGLGGINVDAEIYRPADFLQSATDNLSRAVIVGMLLVLLSLIVLLWDWRAIVASAVTIPLSLLGAVVALVMLGETVNLVLLIGLAAGLVLVIDTAVATTFKTISGAASTTRDDTRPSLISNAAVTTGRSLVYVFVVLLLVLLPVIFLHGSVGALFEPVVLALVVAALASIAVAVAVTPVLAWYLFSVFPAPLRTSPVIGMLRAAYEPVAARVLKMRSGVTIIALALAALAVVLVPLVRQTALVPNVREPALVIDFRSAPGISVPEMRRQTSELTAAVRALSGVSNVGAHIGRSIVGDHIVDVSAGRIWVVLAPDADYEATLAAIADEIGKSPDITADLSTYVNAQVNDALKAPKSDLVVRVYGTGPDVLVTQAEGIVGKVGGIDGVRDLEVERTRRAPAVEIKVNLEAAAQAGITPGDVRRTSATLLSGLIVGQFFEAQKVFDVVVWGKPELRRDIDSIKALLIDTPSGAQVRLGEVADVAIIERAEEIRREASSRYVDILANVDGRDVSAVEADIRALLRTTPMPYEYHTAVLNPSDENSRGQGQTYSVVIASVIGVYLILQAAVAGWRRAAFLSVAVLASMSGAMLAVVLIGNLSLGAYAGLVGVFGLALGQGLLTFRATQEEPDGASAEYGEATLHRVALARFAPIVTSGVALVLFFIVFAFAGGSAGYVLLAPFAKVIVLGAITTVFTSLALLPGLCLVAGPSQQEEELETGLAPHRAAGAAR